jgi:uncharacterized protein
VQLKATGRGAHYSPTRGLIEAMLVQTYRGDWPGRLWGRLPGATRVQALHHRLALLPPGCPDLRVVFLSDLHVGPTTPPALLDRAVAMAAEARPDLLLLGGDYVFLEATAARCDRLSALISRIPATLKAAVLGNHDLWTHHPAIEAALAAAGVQVLVNSGRPLPEPWSQVGLGGLDEPWTGRPDPQLTLSEIAHLDCIIGLAHSPDGLPHLGGRVALLLCGHTHGGQLALPGGRPLVVPGPMGRRYPHGLHAVGDTWLAVSRGLGGIDLPMRSFAPPDLLVLDLTARPPQR